MNQKTAIIIGAGPAGLTAAHELLDKTDIKPVIYEMTDGVGGIARTVAYKGNRIDIGGHRLFSKHDKIIEWWCNFLPLQGRPSTDDVVLKRSIPLSKKPDAPDPEKTDKVMLIRYRISKIFLLGRLFNYPLSADFRTFIYLGLLRTIKIAISYLKIRLFPIRNERNLEDFFINRFGKELYLLFFKHYTQKVWGTSCKKIRAEWGRQRIKSLTIPRVFLNMTRNLNPWRSPTFYTKDVDTSLITQFLYPKLGIGQLWNEVAEGIQKKGGEIHCNHRAIGLTSKNGKIIGITLRNEVTGETVTRNGEYFFSTMPVKDLIQSLGNAPPEVRQVAQGLHYRSLVVVGLLLRELKIKYKGASAGPNNIIPDTWIYLPEKTIKLGRLQIYNNWSPYMLKDMNAIWVGLEFFCSEGDGIWNKSDTEMLAYAIGEASKIGFIDKGAILDNVVIRMPKTYPGYCGTYDSFDVVRNFTDTFENLFLIGRNGMHRYNNMDHAMLTAMAAVENITHNISSKDNLWAINAEQEYHEEK
jgi:protoporphyrinogen oxidase